MGARSQSGSTPMTRSSGLSMRASPACLPGIRPDCRGAELPAGGTPPRNQRAGAVPWRPRDGTMSLKLFDLTGRLALITGSSQGIGLALARGLAEAGADVVLNGRDQSKLAAAAAELMGARTLAFDVTDHAAVRVAIDGFEADDGPIDTLVNNAGVQHRAPLEEFPVEAFERLLATNVASVFNVGQACARHMI